MTHDILLTFPPVPLCLLVMKAGIIFTKKNRSPAGARIKKSFQLSKATTPAVLKKIFMQQEIDFVFVEPADKLHLLKTALQVFELAPRVPVVVRKQKNITDKLPHIQNLYLLKTNTETQELQEILSFHKARQNQTLQSVYDTETKRNHEPFFITTKSQLGIVFADAENSIFYLNDKAKKFLGYKKNKKLFSQYVLLPADSGQQLSASPVCDHTSYDLLQIPLTQQAVSVLHYRQIKEGTCLGHVYFLEDASAKQKQTEFIRAEKAKYEKLTGRLNEVLLHERDTNAYNLAYFRRKLDVEIKHARRAGSNVKLYFLSLPQLEQRISSHWKRRDIILSVTSFLLDNFPEPYIVGHLSSDRWLIISQGEFLKVTADLDVITQQLQTRLSSQLAVAPEQTPLVFQHETFSDLAQFTSSEDVFAAIGVE